MTGPNGVVVPITVEDWPLTRNTSGAPARAAHRFRAWKVGWSWPRQLTSGCAYGCGAEHFMGSIENVEIERLSR